MQGFGFEVLEASGLAAVAFTVFLDPKPYTYGSFEKGYYKGSIRVLYHRGLNT